MCSTMISCCTEGQSAKATDPKTLLQPEDVGVGLWLESGNCNRSEAGGNNVRLHALLVRLHATLVLARATPSSCGECGLPVRPIYVAAQVIIDFYSEDTTNPMRFLDKTSVIVLGAFLMDPGTFSQIYGRILTVSSQINNVPCCWSQVVEPRIQTVTTIR